MARPLRIEFPGAWYHVMNRGIDSNEIFLSNEHRQLFTELLGELSLRFGVEVHAYCLLDDHYHLLLHTPEGNLGQAMRHLNGVYTQRYNRKESLDGPLFNGRYKAIIVDEAQYLLDLSRYIHRLPVEMGLTKRFDRYRWSSYRHYLDTDDGQEWLQKKAVFKQIGRRQRIEKYREYVKAGNSEEITAFYSKQHLSSVLGDAIFRQDVLAKKSDAEQLNGSLRQVVGCPSMDAIIHSVAEEFTVSPQEILYSERGRGKRNIPRAVAMMLCRETGRARLSEVADLFSVGHYSTVSVTVARLKNDLADDRLLAKTVERIRSSI